MDAWTARLRPTQLMHVMRGAGQVLQPLSDHEAGLQLVEGKGAPQSSSPTPLTGLTCYHLSYSSFS